MEQQGYKACELLENLKQGIGLSVVPEGKEIPANLVSYEYNNSFIIAAQKTNEMDDPLYDQACV